MSDFSPATRNSAIWSGDSRRVAQGKANEVILTKLGMMEIPDLSDVEAVQMGSCDGTRHRPTGTKQAQD